MDIGNFSFSSLFAGFVFGVFGFYQLKRSKKNGDVLGIFIGLALMIYPYFIENVFLLYGVGIALTVLGFRRK